MSDLTLQERLRSIVLTTHAYEVADRLDELERVLEFYANIRGYSMLHGNVIDDQGLKARNVLDYNK